MKSSVIEEDEVADSEARGDLDVDEEDTLTVKISGTTQASTTLPTFFSRVSLEDFPKYLKSEKDRVVQTIRSYLACYTEYEGDIYVYKEIQRIRTSRSAWAEISKDFQPAPKFARFVLPDGWVCNQQQKKCKRFEVNISNVQRVADRLLTLHRNFIVHGDLKPEHVRSTDEGNILFIDFDACSLSNQGMFTPEYASAELIFNDGKVKTPADDLEALLWMCWESFSGEYVEMEDGKRQRFVQRLTLMNRVLACGNKALLSAFLHVWMLPRTKRLEDADYKLPLALKLQDVSKRLANVIEAQVEAMYSRKFSLSNDLGAHKNYVDELSLQYEWRNFFNCTPKKTLDISRWGRLRTSETTTDYDLLLFNKHFEPRSLHFNVQPVAEVTGFRSDFRRPYLDNATGCLVVYETSVETKSLAEVCMQMSTLLPSHQEPRAMHIWFAFSSLVLIHKERKNQTRSISVQRDTLSACLNSDNFLGSVLSASGRLGVYLQLSSRLDFTTKVAPTIKARVDDVSAHVQNEYRILLDNTKDMYEEKLASKEQTITSLRDEHSKALASKDEVIALSREVTKAMQVAIDLLQKQLADRKSVV